MRRSQRLNHFARFWALVAITDYGCWEWLGGLDRAGYARFNMANRKWSAHRLAYVIAYGKPPAGLDIDHLCGNRACVRPNHLEAVTHAENVRRGQTGKHWSRRKHCKHGHAYTAENTRWVTHASGVRYRICRTCQRTAVRQSRLRRAA